MWEHLFNFWTRLIELNRTDFACHDLAKKYQIDHDFKTFYLAGYEAIRPSDLKRVISIGPEIDASCIF